MPDNEYKSGEQVPESGVYGEQNIFGTPTGRDFALGRGETFPAVPRGYTYRSLKTLSVAELRARALHYRWMAGTASTAQVLSGLLKLAERFDELADRREADG